uniref:UPF0565 protein C2orf69 homolog n=1 Tax=Cacopsylla melanoneura TaxID=428564 RepID=A0A8D9ED42_9HEMI
MLVDFYSNYELTLVGFSKGCVVLNSILYSIAALPSHPLVGRILDMVWLDGGHGGKRDTWVTDRSVLETFSKQGITPIIFVSPYQVSDSRRPWIGQEESSFHQHLQELGTPVRRTLLHQQLPPSLKSHFLLLKSAVQTRFSTMS